MQFNLKPFLIFFIFAGACWIQAAQATGLPTIKDFTDEARESKKRQVPILVLFMSRSCHYCEKVLADFLLPMQSDPAFNNRVILRQIETSSTDRMLDFNGAVTTHSDFASKHRVWGVPNVMLFDSKGNVLATIEGLLTVDYYYAYLDNAISASQAKIKADSKWKFGW